MYVCYKFVKISMTEIILKFIIKINICIIQFFNDVTKSMDIYIHI